jgi:hypothetical protein
MAKQTVKKQTRSPGKGKQAPQTKSKTIAATTEDVQFLLEEFITREKIDTALTGKERMRLIGAGVKNYGLIDKAYDIARDNPGFMPPFLTPQEMWNDMHDFEDIRQLVMVLEKFLQLATEMMMIQGDKCFRDALRVYDSLKEMAKNKVPGAQPLFESLMSFFRRRRRPGEAEPTMKELEHDFNRLLHGHADGKIEIVSEAPKVKAGVRKIVDDVHKSRAVAKETAEFDEEE